MNNPTIEAEVPNSEQLGSKLLHSTSYIEDCGRACTTPANSGPTDPYRCPDAQVFSAHDVNGGHWHAIETRCRRWSCPGCGPLRTKILCRQLANARPNRLITLTCGRPGGRTPREVWDESRRQVPELIRRIRKHVGEIEYCRVMEEHKSGFPHFHLLARAPYIEQELLSRWWCELTDAFIVDIRKVNPDYKVERYVAKYLCKQYRSDITDRRVTNSKGFFIKADKPEPNDWCFAECSRQRDRINDFLEREWPNADVEWISARHAVVIAAGRAADILADVEF